MMIGATDTQNPGSGFASIIAFSSSMDLMYSF